MKELKAEIIANEKKEKNIFKLQFYSKFLAENSLPGQFVQIYCTDSIDPFLRRPFSIADVDTDKKLITIYYMEVGKGTRLLGNKKINGERISIVGPLGRGFELAKKDTTMAYLVGGGIGGAPLLFLSKFFKKENLKVFLGAASAKDLGIKEEFEANGIKNIYLATEDGSIGYKGLVTELLEQEMNEQEKKSIYGCGPLPMLKSLQEISDQKNVTCQLSLEGKMACGFGVCLGCAVETEYYDYFPKVCKDGPVFWSYEVEIL